MPVPMHMVTMAYRPLRRRSSCSAVAASLAPVQPSGCPSAIAPPLTLRRGSSASRPRPLSTARLWAAKASFSSMTSICSSLSPTRFSTLGTASTGPIPMISGGTPATA